MVELQDFFKKEKIIAAVRNEKQLQKAVNAPIAAIFLLAGDINVLADYVDYARGHHIPVFPHLDLMGGIAGDKAAVKFIAREIRPDGIITTRSTLIKAAKKHDLRTIQRLFLVDSTAVETGIHAVEENQPDAVEIMPGLMPKIISQVKSRIGKPIIAGGLIEDQEDIDQVLNAGALAVSIGNSDLWWYNQDKQSS
ncbi:MAG: glycerol-3-phosphate responsive antiterminator [Bacillota bacterium]|jgi:glycerol uptake operon antiterminator